MFHRPVVLLVAASAIALLPASQEAAAQGLGDAFRFGKAVIDEAARAAKMNPNSGGGSRSSGNSGQNRSREKEEASDGASRQTSQRTAADRATDARNHATQLAETQELERTKRLEQQRNVDAAIRSFLRRLEELHRNVRENASANVRVSSGNNINQVTNGEVKRALENAYKAARLFEFERLAGEIWTRDRLMVRIVNYSSRDLDDYFKGVGVKGASVADLEQMFDRRAKEVFAQALELSELLGVGQSFDRFIRTIYEHSDREFKGLSTIGDDGHYDRLVAGMIDTVPRQTFISDEQTLASDPLGLEKQFLFRFRARRALYDCMSARYAEIVAQRTGATGVMQIAQRDGATTARGAKLDSQPDAAAPSTVDAVGQSPQLERVWDQVRATVSTTCFDPVKIVVTDVKDGKAQPRPVRFDSFAGGSARQAPALVPMGSVTPSR